MNNIITRKKSIATNRDTLKEFVEYPNFLYLSDALMKARKRLKSQYEMDDLQRFRMYSAV